MSTQHVGFDFVEAVEHVQLVRHCSTNLFNYLLLPHSLTDILSYRLLGWCLIQGLSVALSCVDIAAWKISSTAETGNVTCHVVMCACINVVV